MSRSQKQSIVMFCTRTMPTMTTAGNASESFGRRRNHNSLVGFLNLSRRGSLGQLLMQLAQKLQFAIEAIARGTSKTGQPAITPSPL